MVLPTERIVDFLQALIAPGDRVVLEGNNQKQADFLSRSLAQVDPAKVHDLHMIIPSVSRPEQLDLFERGIARKLDFCLCRRAEPAHLAVPRRTACSRSAPSTPTSSSMRGCTWT